MVKLFDWWVIKLGNERRRRADEWGVVVRRLIVGKIYHGLCKKTKQNMMLFAVLSIEGEPKLPQNINMTSSLLR